MTIKETIVDKVFSARFLMAIIFTLSYCLIMIGCLVAVLKKILSVETFIALLATFAIIVRQIADDYFKREDRKKEGV